MKMCKFFPEKEKFFVVWTDWVEVFSFFFWQTDGWKREEKWRRGRENREVEGSIVKNFINLLGP